MPCGSSVWIVAIGLATGCSTAPKNSSPEQTAVVSKEQAKAIIARAQMPDAGSMSRAQSELTQEHEARSRNEQAPSKTPMTYREGLKRIARDLGEEQ